MRCTIRPLAIFASLLACSVNRDCDDPAVVSMLDVAGVARCCCPADDCLSYEYTCKAL